MHDSDFVLGPEGSSAEVRDLALSKSLRSRSMIRWKSSTLSLNTVGSAGALRLAVHVA